MKNKKQITVYFNESNAHIYDYIMQNKGCATKPAFILHILEKSLKEKVND